MATMLCGRLATVLLLLSAAMASMMRGQEQQATPIFPDTFTAIATPLPPPTTSCPAPSPDVITVIVDDPIIVTTTLTAHVTPSPVVLTTTVTESATIVVTSVQTTTVTAHLTPSPVVLTTCIFPSPTTSSPTPSPITTTDVLPSMSVPSTSPTPSLTPSPTPELDNKTTLIAYDCTTGEPIPDDEPDLSFLFAAASDNSARLFTVTSEVDEFARKKRIIIGVDDRVRVAQGDENNDPYCAVGEIPGCTAFFISPRHALTAAHCVIDENNNWLGAPDMWRARNCDNPGNLHICTRVYVPRGWIECVGPLQNHFDYAVIMYTNPSPCQMTIGVQNPWPGLGPTIVGYPGDKRGDVFGCDFSSLCFGCGGNSIAMDDWFLDYPTDTLGGNSGSPVLASDINLAAPFCGLPIAYGIHVAGLGNAKRNRGVRITTELLFQLVALIRRNGENVDVFREASSLGEIPVIADASPPTKRLMEISTPYVDLNNSRLIPYDCATGEQLPDDGPDLSFIAAYNFNSAWLFTNNGETDVPTINSEIDVSKINKRSIIGVDDRVRVGQGDENKFPFCAVGATPRCTAFFISERHALTAAHCIFNPGWRGAPHMWRARNCDNRGQRHLCTRVYVPQGWTDGGPLMDHYDYALIVYATPSPCHMIYGFIDPWPELGVSIVGYPVDKRGRRFGCRTSSMCYACSGNSISTDKWFLDYQVDTRRANDGSPVLASDLNLPEPLCGLPIVHAIHIQGINREQGRPKLNRGVRFTKHLFFQFQERIWKDKTRLIAYDCATGEPILGGEGNLDFFIAANADNRTQKFTGNSEIDESGRKKRIIIGVDDRIRVAEGDENKFPYCAVGETDPGCTAFFISPRHALTAAHCIFDANNNWLGAPHMWRARNCGNQGTRHLCTRVYVPEGWTDGGSKRQHYDYALIVYNNPSPCWVSFGFVDPWAGLGLSIPGYPSGKGPGAFGCLFSSLCFGCGGNSVVTDDWFLEYPTDTMPGNSGSPLLATDINLPAPLCGMPIAYGIHTSGVPNAKRNRGLRITRHVFFQLVQQMIADGEFVLIL